MAGTTSLGFPFPGAGDAFAASDDIQNLAEGINDFLGAAGTFNVKAYGAIGDGVADDTVAIQAAIDAARALTPNKGSIEFPAGSYLVTQSLDLTMFGDVGPIVTGAGQGATKILANLSEAFPVFDFTGTQRARIGNMRINGNAAGDQTCAILVARESVSLRGDQAMLENMLVDGTYADCGVASISADLSSIHHCEIRGPIAVCVSSTDVLGVGSKFEAFAAITGNTLFLIEDCALVAEGTSGVRFDNGAGFTIKDSYVSLEGTSVQAVELTGAGGKALNAPNLRVESTSSATNTSVLKVAAGVDSTRGVLTGDWQLNGIGPVCNVGAGSSLDRYIICGPVIFGSGTASTQMIFSGGGRLRNSQVWNTAGVSATIDTDSWNNTIYHVGGTGNAWTFSASYLNVQYRQTQVDMNAANLNLTGPLNLTGAANVNSTLVKIDDPLGDSSWLEIHLDTDAGDGQGVKYLVGGSEKWRIYMPGGNAAEIYVRDMANGKMHVTHTPASGAGNGETEFNSRLTTTGHLEIKTAGKALKVKEGANATMGTATLVAGTVTVNTTAVTANSRIFYAVQTAGGTQGFLRVSARSAGTSFTIASTSGTETSTITWMLVEPA